MEPHELGDQIDVELRGFIGGERRKIDDPVRVGFVQLARDERARLRRDRDIPVVAAEDRDGKTWAVAGRVGAHAPRGTKRIHENEQGVRLFDFLDHVGEAVALAGAAHADERHAGRHEVERERERIGNVQLVQLTSLAESPAMKRSQTSIHAWK